MGSKVVMSKIKVSIVILFFIIISSCSGPFLINSIGYRVNHDNLTDAWKLASNIKYCDCGSSWKSPAWVMTNNEGDCKAISAYMMYLLGPDSKLVIANVQSLDNLKPDNGPTHAFIEYHDQYIEPQDYGQIYTINPDQVVFFNGIAVPLYIHIYYEWSYDKTMFEVTCAGTRNIDDIDFSKIK
jgi:hypothetical protein